MAEQPLAAAEPTETGALTLSVVIPATNVPRTLNRCLAAIQTADDPPEEIVLSRRVSDGTVPEARNGAGTRASGDVLVFVDADVEVHGDVFTRIRAAFEDPELTAVFGSYDDGPSHSGVVSQFRNLLHHHVHQHSAGRAETFWSGLGAIRRDTFLAHDGFDRDRFDAPSVEDIELGMRLSSAGEKIILDPEIQGKHLKPWTLLSMLRTDLFYRGVPWITLLLRRRTASSALNLGWRHRLSAVAALGALAAAVLLEPIALALVLVLLVALNSSFYALLARRQGFPRAVLGVGLHALHLLAAGLAVVVGTAAYFFTHERWRRAPARLDLVRTPIIPRRASRRLAGVEPPGNVETDPALAEPRDTMPPLGGSVSASTDYR